MPRIDLARVVDLASQLEADADIDPETLRRRDRTLGRELSGRVADATARVEAWLDRRRDGPAPSDGERAQSAQRVLYVVLVLAGLVFGAGTALAVFSYDGRHPVNVLHVLAIFVGLQLLLLAATGVLLLPDRWRRRIPGLAALQDVLRLASPGRWQPALRRVLPPEQRHALDRAAGLALRHQRLYGDVHKWALLVGSQLFAVAFHASAVAAAVTLVTFSDLAFGWSTTLVELSAARLHRWALWLALPWSAWLADAIPSPALIQQTQYFRASGAASLDPAVSAAWWRFLLACMACYGLAPRLLLLALARWRYAAALRRSFGQLPGVAELRDRLDSRWIATGGVGEEAAWVGPAARPRSNPAPRPARVRAVRWSGAPVPDTGVAALVSRALGAELTGVIDAGAGGSVADAELGAALAEADGAPVFLVKAWEPPLLELLDLFGELRVVLGNGAPLFVLPVEPDGCLVRAETAHARVWARRLDASGDPWLEVVTAGQSGADDPVVGAGERA